MSFFTSSVHMPPCRLSQRPLYFCIQLMALFPFKLCIIVFTLIFLAAIEVAMLFFMGQIVETLTEKAFEDASLFLGINIVLGLAFHSFQQLGLFIFYDRAYKFPLLEALTVRTFHHVAHLPSGWYAATFVGATTARIKRLVREVEIVMDEILLVLSSAFFYIVAVCIAFTFLFPPFGLLLIFFIAVLLLYSFFSLKRKVIPLYRSAGIRDSQLFALLADSVSSMQAIKAAAAEKAETTAVAKKARSVRSAICRAYTWNNIFLFSRNAYIQFLVKGFVMVVAVWGVWQGLFSIAGATFIFFAYGVLSGYVRGVSNSLRVLSNSLGDIADCLSLFKVSPERSGGNTLSAANGEITFQSVSFSYTGSKEAALKNISITIPAGQRVALVGESGGGKTTFITLLHELYTLNRGSITIDGQRICDVSLKSLRRNIAMVPQSPVLFHRTIRENICFGAGRVSAQKLKAAITAAHADFVYSFPNGLQTLVGERGVKLSGGQRQRVAIARAFLSQANIIVFDEATSSLDALSEIAIQKACDSLFSGRTAIIIAHRLSTIRHVDRILVFKKGRIVEDGTHAHLLAKKGVYSKLYHAQKNGFIQ